MEDEGSETLKISARTSSYPDGTRYETHYKPWPISFFDRPYGNGLSSP